MNLKSIALLSIPVLLLTGCSNLQTEYAKQKRIIQSQKTLISELDETNSFLKRKNAHLEKLARASAETQNARSKIHELDSQYAQKMNELIKSLSSSGLKNNEFKVTRWKDATVLTLQNSILFGSGKYELTSSGRSVLQRVIGIINEKYPNNRIRVEGHTDTDPIRVTKKDNRHNWDLSAKRAASVVHYLEKKASVNPKRLSIMAYGPNKPVSSSKRENRRVEIAILDNDPALSATSPN